MEESCFRPTRKKQRDVRKSKADENSDRFSPRPKGQEDARRKTAKSHAFKTQIADWPLIEGRRQGLLTFGRKDYLQAGEFFRLTSRLSSTDARWRWLWVARAGSRAGRAGEDRGGPAGRPPHLSSSVMGSSLEKNKVRKGRCVFCPVLSQINPL